MTAKKKGPLLKAGRKSEFQPKFVTIAKEMGRFGATDAQLATAFDVTVTTITNWKQAHPSFVAALQAGKDEADNRVVRSLYERATGYEHPAIKIMQYEGQPIEVPYTERYPPDPAAMIFWLKNRRRLEWRDKHDVEHSGSPELIAALDAARERATGR